MRGFVLGVVAAGSVGAARGQALYDFVVDGPASAVHTTALMEAPMAGALIGNYDELNNPTGTQTRPGLFGGSGNQPIPYTATGVGSGNSTTRPTGVFALEVNEGALTVALRGLSVDALSGQTPGLTFTLNLLYQTFRTFNPNSLYPGGVTLPIPLGEARLTRLTLEQVGAVSQGALTEVGEGEYTFAVGAEVAVEMEATLPSGEVFAPGAVVTPMVFSGTLRIEGRDATATLSGEAGGEQEIPGPFEPGFENVPMDVPTVLPPGAVAHLLMSGVVQSVRTGWSADAMIVAAGREWCAGDTNGDGVVDFADLNAVLGAFGTSAGEPGFMAGADVNRDGRVNFMDLNIVLGAFGTSC